jgi:hypothetical protein
MKRIIALLCLLSVTLGLFGCGRVYEGPTIDSIEYNTLDYMGGMMTCNKLDLKEGELLIKYATPSSSQITDYRTRASFDPTLSAEILNAFYTHGLLDLKEEYTSEEDADDGGEWSIVINYADGKRKVSRGINAVPDMLESCDRDFFDLTGEEFFGLVPEDYRMPPALQLTVSHRDGKNQSSEGLGSIVSKVYTWRGFEHRDPQWFITQGFTSLRDSRDYSAALSVMGKGEKIRSAKVYTSALAPKGTKEIECRLHGGVVEFDIEPNLNYTVIVEYKNGTGEYYFNTHVPSDD